MCLLQTILMLQMLQILRNAAAASGWRLQPAKSAVFDQYATAAAAFDNAAACKHETGDACAVGTPIVSDAYVLANGPGQRPPGRRRGSGLRGRIEPSPRTWQTR